MHAKILRKDKDGNPSPTGHHLVEACIPLTVDVDSLEKAVMTSPDDLKLNRQIYMIYPDDVDGRSAGGLSPKIELLKAMANEDVMLARSTCYTRIQHAQTCNDDAAAGRSEAGARREGGRERTVRGVALVESQYLTAARVNRRRCGAFSPPKSRPASRSVSARALL